MTSSDEDDEMAKVIDLDAYRRKKKNNGQLRETLNQLEDMAEEVYDTYSEEEQIGYERFKRLLEVLQLGEYETTEEDQEE